MCYYLVVLLVVWSHTSHGLKLATMNLLPLSRERINDIAKDLKPTRDSLRYWQRLGAFEPKINQPQKADKQHTKKVRRVKRDSQSKKGKKQITKVRKQKILLQK